MMRQPGAELAFTDRRGSHWVRLATGDLCELASNPIDYFEIPRPVSLYPPNPDPD